jgi:hypothetical protein
MKAWEMFSGLTIRSVVRLPLLEPEEPWVSEMFSRGLLMVH